MNRKYVCIIIAVFLIIGMVVYWGGRKVATAPAYSEGLKIASFVYSGDDTFISNMMGSLRQVVEDYEKETGEHIYLNILDAQASQTTQNGQMERYIALEYDVLCVNLVDRTSAAYIINKAMDASIPIVFYNREPVQADLQKWDHLYYVGTDPSLNGRLEGQIVADAYHADPTLFDKNGDGILQYIMLEGESRHQDAILRTDGSVQAIMDTGIRVEKLDGGIANWDRSQASALAKDYFEKYGNQIELIIANNDDMALGVVDIVEEMGLDFSNIVGIDGTPQGLQAVKDGKMLGTVVIDYQGQAEMIFKIACALAKGEDPQNIEGMEEDHSFRVPMYVVTKNMDY